MKKILFIIMGDVRNALTSKLLLNYPYGKTSTTEWQIMVKDEKNMRQIQEISLFFDSIYEISLSSQINHGQDTDQIIINNTENSTFLQCSYINTPYIFLASDIKKEDIFFSKNNTSSINLLYDKTADAQYDFMRIKNDFLNIIYRRSSKNMPKQLYGFVRFISQQEKTLSQLLFKEYRQLDSIDKKLLSLPQQEDYISTFVNSDDIDPDYYCCLYKKIRNVIHFDAWIQMATNTSQRETKIDRQEITQ